MAKPLADEAITTILRLPRELLMLSCRAALPLSRSTLTHLSGVIRRHRARIASCWRKLNPGQQALLGLVHLRNGETFAGLAAGFGVGTATAWRYATEAVALPGSAHDLTCARIWDILSELAAAGLIVLADPPGSCKVVGRNRRQVTVPAGRCGHAAEATGEGHRALRDGPRGSARSGPR